MKKENLFNSGVGKAGQPHTCQLEYTLIPCTKIYSKWFKVLNTRQDTIKLLEGNTDQTFSDINRTNVFLGQSPKAIEIKAKNHQMGPNQT